MLVYWTMFITCTVMAFFSQRRAIRKADSFGKAVGRPDALFVIFSALPLIFFVGMRGNMTDTSAYIRGFKSIDYEYIKDVFSHLDDNKDVGFKVFTYLIKCITDNYTVYLFIIAAFCVLCIWLTFYRHSDSFTLSVFLFFGTTEFYWLLNGMRQYIAVCAMFLAFPLLLKTGDGKKDFWKCVLFVLISCFFATFHFSALFAIPLFFLCRGRLFGRWQMLAAAAISVLSVMVEPVVNFITDTFSDTQYSGIVDDMELSAGSNPLRLVVAAIPVALVLCRFPRVKALNDKKLNFCINMSIFNFCFMIPATLISGNQFARVADYFGIFNLLLYPMTVNRLYFDKERKLLKTFMVVLYVIWFYYQMAVVFGGIYTSQYF